MQKSVFAAIAGEPNVGKSTLLNRLVGARIAITAPRPQTTRNRIMGVVTPGETQFVFTDTPGYHRPKTKLGEHMVNTVRESCAEVDVAVFVTTPRDRLNERELELLDALREARRPVLLVLNKADTLTAAKAERLLEEFGEKEGFASSLALSALTGKGCDRLMAELERFAVAGPHLFEDDTLTDQPEKVIAAEIVREKLLLNLYDELPHGCAVNVESFKERQGGGIVDIEAVILCEKQSHKGMIIGKGGAMLKKIGSQARHDIEQFLGCRVNLKCWVKVREDWRNSENYIREFGY